MTPLIPKFWSKSLDGAKSWKFLIFNIIVFEIKGVCALPYSIILPDSLGSLSRFWTAGGSWGSLSSFGTTRDSWGSLSRFWTTGESWGSLNSFENTGDCGGTQSGFEAAGHLGRLQLSGRGRGCFRDVSGRVGLNWPVHIPALHHSHLPVNDNKYCTRIRVFCTVCISIRVVLYVCGVLILYSKFINNY